MGEVALHEYMCTRVPVDPQSTTMPHVSAAAARAGNSRSSTERHMTDDDPVPTHATLLRKVALASEEWDQPDLRALSSAHTIFGPPNHGEGLGADPAQFRTAEQMVLRTVIL